MIGWKAGWAPLEKAREECFDGVEMDALWAIREIGGVALNGTYPSISTIFLKQTKEKHSDVSANIQIYLSWLFQKKLSSNS